LVTRGLSWSGNWNKSRRYISDKSIYGKKLSGFAKEEGTHFSLDIFIKTLEKISEAGMSESNFAERDHIPAPFKMEIVKDEEAVLKQKE
jgi:hypothetical protein